MKDTIEPIRQTKPMSFNKAKMIKAALFDIDGTLIDSNDLHVEAWHQIFAESGYEIDSARIHDQIGKGGDYLVPALLPELGKPEQKTLADGHGRLFKQLFLGRAKPFPGARELLEKVHAGGSKVVLASSASQEELDHYIDLLSVRHIIAATTSIDDVKRSKPAPDIFAAAVSKAGVEADEAIAVGDSPYDVRSAAKAGVPTIALLSGGFDEAVLIEAGAIEVYANSRDLLVHFETSGLAR